MQIESIKLLRTNMPGFSILVIRKPGDHDNTPAVHQQFPTDIAQYVKGLIEADQAKVKT
jgi:hypothetical protein